MTEADAGERQIPPAGADAFAFQPGARLPASCDVLIIGGGIVGVSAAYQLARRGLAVVLCEKGRIAGEQSGRNWGWVRQQGRDLRELPLMIQSLKMWRELGAELGEDLGFTQGGCLYLAESDTELAYYENWLAQARGQPLDSRMLSTAELGLVLASPQPRWLGALYTASDGRAEPNRAAPGIARGAQRAGARILSGCAVRGLERAAGRVRAVVTEHGAIASGTVVCAAGAWSSLFCRAQGIDVPQLRVKGTVARTAPTAKILNGAAYCSAVAIRRRADGGYTVAHGSRFDHPLVPASFRYARQFWPALRQEQGAVRLRVGRDFFKGLLQSRSWDLARPSPFEHERVLNPAPDAGTLAEMRVALAAAFPQLAATPFVESWAGMIESSPDVLPIISGVDTLPGFFIATGFSGHGFGIGPAAGQLVADLVTGKASAAALQSFRLQRFYDGSGIRPGPTI
jgi:glycine/D-amino acid oxidase-like deaminating enzyme